MCASVLETTHRTLDGRNNKAADLFCRRAGFVLTLIKEPHFGENRSAVQKLYILGSGGWVCGGKLEFIWLSCSLLIAVTALLILEQYYEGIT